jgi:transposase
VDGLRDGSVFPPIELDVNELVLLDGYHRWKAYQEAGIEVIDALLVNLEGMPRLLYSAGRNSLHGDRLSNSEKREVARQMAEAGVAITVIKEQLKVSLGTVSNWVSDIIQRRQRERDARIWWLHLLGWTEREIAQQVGVSNGLVHEVCSQISDLKKVSIDQSSRGRTVAQIAEAESVPDKLVEVLLLDGKNDQQRMEYLKVGIQPYDFWSFSGCDSRFGFDYPGRIPGQLVLHVLYFYTKPGDLVVDPMAGSGTVIDACAYMNRKVYGYDAHSHELREDIIAHDLLWCGWPKRTCGAKLIFWDPPYFKKKDDGYGDKSISRLSKSEYLEFFEVAANNIPKKFKGKLVFLCSDYNDEDNPEDNIFFWEYVNIFIAAGWRPERHIQVPLTTQQVHPDVAKRFREQRRLARLGRDLVVFKYG